MSDDSALPDSKKGWVTPDQAYTRWLKFMEPDQEGSHRFKSGFEVHDRKVGYFQRGGLYLFGARPGVGKTSYLISLAHRQTLQGVTVHFLNLEMTVEEMWCRFYCLINPGTDLRAVMERRLSQGEKDGLLEAASQLRRVSPLWLEDHDFGSFARLVKQTIVPGSNSVVIIDYIGLFTMRGLGPGDDYTLMSEVAKQLKLMARALNMPVLAAAQLNREFEKRKPGSRMTLADLRGSGELENHAHAVFGLTRDSEDRLDIAVLKNRNGPVGDYDLRYDAPRAAVEDW